MYFWWPETRETIVFIVSGTFFAIFDKSETSIPKWLQNRWKMHLKSTLSPPGSSFFMIFDVLERFQKIMFFWCLSKRSKNQENRSKERSGGLPAVTPELRRTTFAGWCPWGAAFSRATGLLKRDKKACWLVGTRKRQVEGSNTPVGQRPGEFMVYFKIRYLKQKIDEPFCSYSQAMKNMILISFFCFLLSWFAFFKKEKRVFLHIVSADRGR